MSNQNFRLRRRPRYTQATKAYLLSFETRKTVGAGPPLHHRERGCPTLRGFRSVGTTDLDSLFIHHIQTFGIRATYPECPIGFIATMALDVCTLSRPVVTSDALCSGSRRNRDLFLQVLQQVRRRYHFVVVGYVVMPEHVHLLSGEPERGNPSVVMPALKQGFRSAFVRRVALAHPSRARSVVERGPRCRAHLAAALL